jgi:glutathione peroxidase-family protein
MTDTNYKQLQALHTKYGQSADASSPSLRILAFPCNQFGSQEPGTDAEIKEFATGKYGAEFDLFSKINVNGNDAHPLWKYLKSKQSGFLVDAIKWNFTKFLVNKEGIPVKRYAPNVQPNNIEKDIVEELKK